MITITMNNTDYEALIDDRRKVRELTRALGNLYRLSLINDDIEAGVETKVSKEASAVLDNFIQESITLQLKANPDMIRSLVKRDGFPAVYDTQWKRFYGRAYIGDPHCVDLTVDDDYVALVIKIAKQVAQEEEDARHNICDNISVEEIKTVDEELMEEF